MVPAERVLRPDIQALRAVAVSAVVGYHLWPHALPGGFVGVDVFFAISGFLITRQLAAELARDGRLSLTRFWARRIRRLLPAALVVLAVCLAVLLSSMPRLTWADNLRQIRAAAVYGLNWLLGHDAIDYLAAEHSPSLVQHYWSLSVEEQFYLGWPFLLLVAFLLGRRRGLTVMLAGVAVASFVLSVRWTAAQPAMAFYATPTRAWEFAVGGLVALRRSGRHRASRPALRSATAWAGLGLIGASLFVIGAAEAFPGWIAILPVAGAGLVLGSEAPRVRWSPLPAMRLRPVQWVGDVSYSLYLWHWPLIVALPWQLHHALRAPEKVAIAATSLVLAGLTKVLVEDPVRRGRAFHRRRWPSYALAFVGVGILLTTTSAEAARIHRQQLADIAAASRTRQAEERQIERQLAAPPPSPSPAAVAPAHPAVTVPRSCFGAAAILPVNRCALPFRRPAHLDTEFAQQDGAGYDCLQQLDATTPQPCVFGDRLHPRRTIAIVGNSHARRLAPALDLYGQRHHWKIVLAAEIDCLGQTSRPTSVQSAALPCLRWSAAVQRLLLRMPRLTAVLFVSHRSADEYLAGRGASVTDRAVTRQRVLATWSRFRARGARVMVTEDVPGMRPAQDPQCIAMSTAVNDPCSTRRASVLRPNFLTDLALSHPAAATYLPLHQYFCDATRCHGLIGGVVVYFDSHHLTDTYSRSMAPYFGAQVAAALNR